MPSPRRPPRASNGSSDAPRIHLRQKASSTRSPRPGHRSRPGHGSLCIPPASPIAGSRLYSARPQPLRPTVYEECSLMRLRADPAHPTTTEADVLALPIYRDEELTGDLAELDSASGGAIRRAIEWGEFNVIEHAVALVDAGDLPVDRLLLVNGGTRGRGAWRARRVAAVATRRLQGRGAPRMALWLRDGEDDDVWEAAAIGAMAGTYRPTAIYGRVRDTDAMGRSVEEVICLGSASQAALDRGLALGEGVAFGRDLANRSANDLYPERMAEVARELEADGCSVEVLEPDEMARLGMGLLLGV